MSGLRLPSTPRASLSASGGSALPTPSSRRKSGVPRPPSSLAHNGELSALRQAISAHDPASYAASPGAFDDPDSPFAVGIALGGHPAHEGSSGSERATRQPVLPGVRTGPVQPRAAVPSRPTTPSTPSYARARTPTGFGSSTSRFTRPTSRQSGGGGDELTVGREVAFEIAGDKMEGTLRFVGEVEGKSGQWGGVELDAAFAGRGKNDGSVAGVQYFACPPQCGLFLPLAKVTAKPRPSMPPPLTAGSRASRMAGMSAKDLASRRSSLAPSSTTTTSATPATRTRSPTKPRTSLSPTKPRTSMSPTKRLSASTSAAPSTLTTPKPTRLSRPSIGGAVGSTPTTMRKSLGATPRASLGGSIKRPPSSLRTHSAAPDVPPIPSAYGLARSVTPSSQSGRVTPSTPGAMMRRRTSLAQSDLGSSIRPSTPSLRSSSRQSFASSVSRQSHRSTTSTTADPDELDDLRRELAEAQQREGEIRQLLEGSERLGREVEDRLGEKNRRIADLEERLAVLEKERERAREDEDARLAAAAAQGGEEGDRAARVRELEKRVEEQQAAIEAHKAAHDKLKREDKHRTAAKEAEVESLRERLERSAKDHDEERADLSNQVDKLRSAGQALCETYEEKIAEIELARLEAVELAETLQAQLEGAGDGARAASSSREDSPSASRHHLSASVSAAQAIDAENTRAELDHLRDKVATLEEQLEDARMQLEQEFADAKSRRTKVGEAEQRLKGEIASLKEAVDRSAKAESRLAARIDELQAALHESQATLEAERSELEGLRHDASGDATASIADDLKRVHNELSATKADLERTQRDAAQHTGLVGELRTDLRNAEKEIERLQKLAPPSPSSNVGARSSSSSSSSPEDPSATREQIVGLKSIIETLTEENKQLVDRNKAIEGETAGLKDSQRALEMTVENLMAQLDSGSATATAAPGSPSSSLAADSSLRRELEELRGQLKEVQRKSDLEIKALTQEVTELESLVESKIYHEDELESELEKYKALADAVKAGPASSNGHAKQPSVVLDAGEVGECEMCGEKGHDLDSCPDFAASSPTRTSFSSNSLADLGAETKPASKPSASSTNAADYCDDCEEYGHALEDCPLASEIF
ncbi:uncharacterized protein RHOBADRAFT_53266 [Rhodotorula graminis WP1]|uniref:CAP-Gly domain-containing protein n=1 Tax=Rhodotorula graminis (strain WP1) TaxID=578459 RepID=A0A194S420_RHOGW|nr:uncharacterized protein RHOBADRAFT_53266 [Rhodotorula graminis WP1]KPV75269.1 hypothetical protein RHOBADRAFT_53266 [Rhodotorula graminis WP1]